MSGGTVVVGLVDTTERRWGDRIEARGIYRDPVRSSPGFFVKVSGLRWLSLSVLAPVSWAGLTCGVRERRGRYRKFPATIYLANQRAKSAERDSEPQVSRRKNARIELG